MDDPEGGFMEYIEEIQEQVILVGVQLDENDNVKESLDELEELADTAGAQTVGKIIQNRETVHPGTYIGNGKIEEVRALMLATDATGIICDDELSPAQMNNLEHELECKVMDRTLLILDIFAKHATTSEGKIQVELAQLRYRASRLVGLGASLSRLGGGIGTRGPGEKKLESDRRLIRKRITALKEELSQVEKHRELLRTGRTRGKMKTAAIVGYTNAGKSTLLNRLTGAGILAEDKLFATLDPTTRSYTLEDGQQILLTDFEGFCISCILHTFNECVDFLRLDALQIITNTDIELETIHTAKAVFLCHKGKQKPCLNVFILCLRNIKLGRPLTVVSFIIRFDTWLVDTCCQFITIHDLNGFQFKETAAGIIRSRNILS